jgi:preprotein translocase subunit SecG
MNPFLYSFGPFSLLTIANFLLIYYLIMTRSSIGSNEIAERQNKKFNAINRTVIVLTIFFIAMTLPNAIISFNYSGFMSSHSGKILVKVANCLSFSYHASGVLVLYLSNYKFRQEFKNLFRIKNDSSADTSNVKKTKNTACEIEQRKSGDH